MIEWLRHPVRGPTRPTPGSSGCSQAQLSDARGGQKKKKARLPRRGAKNLSPLLRQQSQVNLLSGSGSRQIREPAWRMSPMVR